MAVALGNLYHEDIDVHVEDVANVLAAASAIGYKSLMDEYVHFIVPDAFVKGGGIKTHSSVHYKNYFTAISSLVCRARGPGLEPRSCHFDFRDCVSPASKSQYGWTIVKAK